MRLSRALQWGIYDRLLAVGSLALGLALALGAIWVGTGDWIASFATGDLGARPSGDGVAVTAIGLLAGLFVWQVGATAARYRTLVGATRRELTGVSTDAGGDLEERIGQLESDVEEVRRVAARIEQGMRTGEFDAAGLDGDSSAGSGRAAGDAAASETDGDGGTRSPSGSAAVATGSSDAPAADDADATADGGRAGTDQADGVQFSGDENQSTAATDGAASGTGDGQDAASSTDGGTTADAAATDAGAGAGAGDDATADGTAADGAAAKEGEDEFEWPEEDDDGEYYRNS